MGLAMHGWDLESNELLVQELESDVAGNEIESQQ